MKASIDCFFPALDESRDLFDFEFLLLLRAANTRDSFDFRLLLGSRSGVRETSLEAERLVTDRPRDFLLELFEICFFLETFCERSQDSEGRSFRGFERPRLEDLLRARAFL